MLLAKSMKSWILVLLLFLQNNSAAAAYVSADCDPDNPVNIMSDIMILRPIGLAATLAGTGLLIGLTPLIAIASIPEPHDAFPRVTNILVAAPGYFTFLRPVGYLCPD